MDKARDNRNPVCLPAPSQAAKRVPRAPEAIGPPSLAQGANASALAAALPPSAQDLSTVELVKSITSEMGHLVRKQVELAKTEVKADLKAEAKVLGGLGIAALAALVTLNLVFVAAVLALGQAMPGWAAALVVAAVTALASAVVASVAWRKRVRSPLARTGRTLREDFQWTKERLA